jgi:GT2 family glycosyltransferase
MLKETVESVLAGERVPAEILVVDQSDAPHPELASMGEARGCTVRYLHSTAPGTSRARNTGFHKARYDTVVLLDDDMYVASDWLEKLLGGLGGEESIATGQVLAAEPEEPGRRRMPAAALMQDPNPAVYRGPQPLDIIKGANVAMPRRLVLGVGGYDERMGPGTRFPAAEDNDLGYRLLRAGCEVRHVPEAIVYHRAWRTRRELVRMTWNYGRGMGAFYAKHLGDEDGYIAWRLRRDLWRHLSTAVRLVRRAPRHAGAELISITATIVGMLGWLATVRLPGALRRKREGARGEAAGRE